MAATAFVLRGAVGCSWGGRFGGGVDESAASSSGEAPWRIMEELGGSGLRVPVSVGLFFCSLFVFVGAGDGVYGEGRWRYVYQLGRPGWCLDPTLSGGLHPLPGVLFSGVVGWMWSVASVPFFTGEVMADGHLAWPARSSSIRHVGFPDMLLLVPFLNSAASSSGGWSAPRHLPRPPATRATWCSLQGLVCNFLFFEWCLCKLNDVNCQTFL